MGCKRILSKLVKSKSLQDWLKFVKVPTKNNKGDLVGLIQPIYYAYKSSSCALSVNLALLLVVMVGAAPGVIFRESEVILKTR